MVMVSHACIVWSAYGKLNEGVTHIPTPHPPRSVASLFTASHITNDALQTSYTNVYLPVVIKSSAETAVPFDVTKGTAPNQFILSVALAIQLT